MDWELVNGIAALIAIGGGAYGAVWWLRKNWSKVRPWITPVALASGDKPIPKETFRIVLDTERPPWWKTGKQGGEPATQFAASFYVTNIAGEPVLVVGCKLKPKGADQTYDLGKLVRQLLNDERNTPTVLVSVDGFINPPITKEGETLEAQIIVVDQYGNENLGPMTTFVPH